jgi:hypothetical protein
MGQQTISVRVSGEGIRAMENPTGAHPGDTVTWLFQGDTVGKDVRVVFREVEPADGSPTAECGPNGPFSELARSADRIVGRIPSPVQTKGRFLYDVFEGDKKLEWINRLPPDQNFGGLDIPPPPPRSG